MRGASFWHSPVKLATTSLALLILLILYESRNAKSTLKRPETPKKSKLWGNFYEDIEEAFEAISYMKALPLGKAHVRDVWEDEQEIEDLSWNCYPPFPKTISSKGNWIGVDGQLQLYSAHLDRRGNSLFPYNHAIQVLSMSDDSIEKKINVYCTIYAGKETKIVKGYIREIWQRAWDPRRGFWQPNLITCPIPNHLKDHNTFIISISKDPCEGEREGAFKVEEVTEKHKKALNERLIAVCVKGMDFQEEISDRFLEWMEAQRLFGVNRVAVYTYSESEKTRKVLNHYKDLGFLDWTKLSLPNGFPNEPTERSAYIWRNRQQKRRMELIPYNDCYYRFIETHDYVLIIDIDELVVPLKHENYSQMLFEFERQKPEKKLSSISIRNVFKFPSKQPDTRYDANVLWMLGNRERSKRTSKVGDYGKSFTSTQNAASVFNHFALHRLSKQVSASVALPQQVAVKLHYKSTCPIESKNECEELLTDRINDTSLDPWADRLSQRVLATRKELGF